MFDWNDLRHLLAVARHGSTLAAGRSLGLSQSTVQRRLIELERRGCKCGYVRTPEGFEVDFLATPITGKPSLIQVCADTADPATRAREFRAIEAARAIQRRRPALLLTLNSSDAAAAQAEAPKGVAARPAWEWLLANEERA